MYAEDGVSPGTITLGNATGTGGDIYFQNTRTIENFITAGGPSEALYIDAGGMVCSAVRDVAGVFEALGAAPLWVVGPEVERA